MRMTNERVESAQTGALEEQEAFLGQTPMRVSARASMRTRRCIPHAEQRVSIPYFFLIITWALLGPVFTFAKEQTRATTGDPPAFASIPASNLDVDRATATISVSQESSSPIQSLLHACQADLPEIIPIEDPDTLQEVQALCKSAERWTKRHMPPLVHQLAPTNYTINVPLKHPYGHIRAILWRAKNLDEALTFVRMLQRGALHSVTVFTITPGDEDPSQPCSECPVKELVFRLSHIKDELDSLLPDETQ